MITEVTVKFKLESLRPLDPEQIDARATDLLWTLPECGDNWFDDQEAYALMLEDTIEVQANEIPQD